MPMTDSHDWTVADHVQAVVDAGCYLLKFDEFGDKVDDEFWLKANPDKLPAAILIVGRKETAGGKQAPAAKARAAAV